MNTSTATITRPTNLAERMDQARGCFTPHLDAIAVKPVTEWVWRPGFGWVERTVATQAEAVAA